MIAEKEDESSVSSSRFFTFIAFVCGLLLFPFILICYIVMKIVKKLWIAYLSYKFSSVSIVKRDSIRTLLDTQRNQGIINTLIVIKGKCETPVIHQTIMDHLIEKRDKMGNLCFPKLRSILVSCWGNYAWDDLIHFGTENHLILGETKFRGRPISDHNLHDYISDIVSKFLPPYVPPWQIILLPEVASDEPKYAILVRVHHVLLEEDNLSISDFLCLKPEGDQFLHHTPETSHLEDDFDCSSPLSDILLQLTALPDIYNRLSDSLSNRWNEFISKFDPTTSSKILKDPPGFFHCVALILISFVATFKELSKYSGESTINHSYFFDFIIRFLYETKKRNLSCGNVLYSLYVTFNPVSIIKNVLSFLWCLNLTFAIKLPTIFYWELKAINSYLKRDCPYPNTLVANLQNYLPLMCAAGKEIAYISKLIYTGPIILFEEIFLSDKNPDAHQLQRTWTSGRKVVSWSTPVSRKYIKEIASNCNVSETEVLFAMTTCCIKEYFHHSVLTIPDTVLTSTRTISNNNMLSPIDHSKKNKGFILFSLPVGKSCSRHSTEDLAAITDEVKRVREKQGIIFLLGCWKSFLIELFPSILARIALNCGSRRFSVAIVEMLEDNNMHGECRLTRWGQTVETLLSWRPPQGNVGMSLTIQRYANTVRLGVMTDALISPHHHAPASYWKRAAKRLHHADSDSNVPHPHGEHT